MRAGWCVAAAGAIFGMAAMGRAQAAAQDTAVGSLQVKQISLAEIDMSHVRVAVDLTLVPAQTATLKDLHLCSLHLNGMPVFAAPVKEDIALQKGVPVALPSLYVTALFRDLYTVEPLRQMIEKQSVHVQGELVAGVRLNFIEKLALHTQHPGVAIALSQDVPAQVGGTALERNVALAMLGVIDSGLEAKAKAGQYIPGAEPAWIRDLETQAQANLFDVESSYALTQSSASYPVVSDELGFRVAAGKVVTGAEALAPWKYDAEFLAAVKSGSAKLVKKSTDIELRPVGAKGAALKLSAKDFSVDARGNPDDNSMSAVTPALGTVQVLMRASPSSLAVLELRAAGAGPGLSAAPAAVAKLDSWDQVAVFRMRVDPATGARSVEVLQMGARREGKGIQLTEPVDAAVFGSPIVTPDGVIGLVQDEQTGAFLPADLAVAAAQK